MPTHDFLDPQALAEDLDRPLLAALPPGALSPKSLLILTYALGSFGNVGSVAILIGSLSSMAPEKVGEVVELGFKALAAAFLTTCLTATIMGVIGG